MLQQVRLSKWFKMLGTTLRSQNFCCWLHALRNRTCVCQHGGLSNFYTAANGIGVCPNCASCCVLNSLRMYFLYGCSLRRARIGYIYNRVYWHRCSLRRVCTIHSTIRWGFRRLRSERPRRLSQGTRLRCLCQQCCRSRRRCDNSGFLPMRCRQDHVP